MKNSYKNAYKEVLVILNHLSKEEYEKIPSEQIKFYSENCNKDYNFTFDPSIPLLEQNILDKTYAILISLYDNYFANEKQKRILKELLKINLLRKENEKSQKYSTNIL